MNRNGNERKRFDYCHILCLAITVAFALCGIFLYASSFGRLIEGGRDLGLSLGFYFCEILGIPHRFSPTVNNLSAMPYTTFLPTTWTEFKANWARYWRIWATADNFTGYMSFLLGLFYNLCMVILFVLPFILLAYLFFVLFFKKVNNDYNKDSRSLTVFKWLSTHTYRPVKQWLAGFWAFIKDHKQYIVLWVCLWLFYFNVFTILLEFLAYYFYFVVTFDLFHLYTQVYKLFLDLSVPFTSIPLWVWAVIGIALFDWLRKSIAYARLNHYEMRNRGFINARPIVFMVCGTMGKKKTTAITDMSLSQEVMFRDKAFEKILENDLKFPNFPWCNLENELRLAMEYHEVYNLATVRKFIEKKRDRWAKRPTCGRIFDYDYERYGLEYDDKLRVIHVWETIETYAQLYFIYIIQSSLLISNYSIRVDNVLADLGNFPLWNSDFFKTDSRLIDSYSRHAHILDFDTLRLGKKVVENNRNANNFEFGVIVITEVGKERGNILDNREKKKQDTTANQNNDLFDDWLKMVRHSATVDNFPFVRVITDEQRPENWGANARTLCEIVHIRESGDTRLAMPFFSLAELLYSWLFGKFSGLYYKYRFSRSDNTLPMYLLKNIVAKVQHYYAGIYNRFGYCRLSIQVESGTQDGRFDDNEYYLMSKKIYSKRFSTDCFSDFFTEKALRSPVGIDDLREYVTEKATFAELGEQNSYFVRDLLSGLTKDDDKQEQKN